MRCPCQDKPVEQRPPVCPWCGNTGVASCCEAERPTHATERHVYEDLYLQQMPVMPEAQCPVAECARPTWCTNHGRCWYNDKPGSEDHHGAESKRATRATV